MREGRICGRHVGAYSRQCRGRKRGAYASVGNLDELLASAERQSAAAAEEEEAVEECAVAGASGGGGG